MISIIVPVYNVQEYLSSCLKSIQEQSFSDFEVLCINDGSCDNSRYICEQFVSNDSRFKLFNQDNMGVSAARNLGLANAKGELICFIDADDKVHRDYLLTLLKYRENDVLPICSFTFIEDKLGVGNSYCEYNAVDFIMHIFAEDIPHPNLWAMLFDAKVIKDNNLNFVVGCIKNEDTEFFVKYIAYIKKVIVCNFKGYFYRVNPKSCMNSKLDCRSLTSIEAQNRMAIFLSDRKFISNPDRILGASIQVYVYLSAKNNNKEIFDAIHSKYNVKYFMKCMISHPRYSRKIVSIFYLVLGRNLFYNLFSFVSVQK